MKSNDIDLKGRGGEKAARGAAFLKDMLFGFAYSAIAFMLGCCVLPFGAIPLGMSLICSADRKVTYIFGGLALSAFLSDKPLILIAAYAVALFTRILVRLTLDPPWDEAPSGALDVSEVMPCLFGENLFLRMATSCIGVFVVGLYSLIEGGFLYYDLFGAVISMIAAPLGVAALYGAFSERDENSAWRYVAYSVIVFGSVYATSDFDVYGLSAAVVGSMILTLYVCRKKGLLFGMGAGAVCGLAYAPMLAPSFFLAALAAGALLKVSVFFAVFAAFCAGLFFSVYIGGMSMIVSFMPSLLAGCLIYAVADKTFFDRANERSGEGKNKTKASVKKQTVSRCGVARYELGEVRLEALTQRTRELCDTFSELSQFFFELGEKMRTPLVCDTKNICDSAFDSACASCRCNTLCWEERHTDTMAAVTSLCASLHRNGKITDDAVPLSLRSVCQRLPDIIDGINHNYSLHVRRLLLCDKTEIFALDYKAISELLLAGLEGEREEHTQNLEMTELLCRALEKSGLGAESAAVFGGERKKAIVRLAALDEEKRGGLVAVAEQVCGLGMRIVSVKDSADNGSVALIMPKDTVSAECVQERAMSQHEKSYCGDSMSAFENGEGMFYSIISDGMGSGREAALTSGISVMFMKKMLSSSASCENALRMLNGFLRNKGSGSMHECSATVDIMELDKVKAKAAFYKSGAAPSYVFRDGNLFRLRSKTVPMGIIRELDTKKLIFDVKRGDIIVMVSDGVTQGRDECPWLLELLRKNVGAQSLKRCAELIIERARRDSASDDISVSLISIGGCQ